VDEDGSLKPGSECDPSLESARGAESGPDLCLEHCWGAVGGEDVNLSGDLGTFDIFFDVFDSSYLHFPVEPIFTVPSIEPQLEPLTTLSDSSLMFSSFNDATLLADGMMLQANQQDRPWQDIAPIGLPSPVDMLKASALRSSPSMDEERQSNDFTDITY
jgi:hypothetical protein